MKLVSAIVLAAGRGVRLKSKTPKPLTEVNSQPIIIHSLKTLSAHPSVRDIVVVVNDKTKGRIIALIKKYRIAKVVRLVRGGLRRQDSVRRGLEALPEDTGLVLIHDGARPFIDRDTISSLIKEACRLGAAIAGVPIKATIKEVHSFRRRRTSLRLAQFIARSPFIVKKTLNRERLWEIQTPQVFRKNLILKAYKKFGNIEVTDDAMLVEKLGAKVSVVLGSYSNIKITTPEDLVLAETIAKSL